jgi:hypothetical protein
MRDIFRAIGHIEQKTWGGTQAPLVQGHRGHDLRKPVIKAWRAPDARPHVSAAAHNYFRKERPMASITVRSIKLMIPLPPPPVIARG